MKRLSRMILAMALISSALGLVGCSGGADANAPLKVEGGAAPGAPKPNAPATGEGGGTQIQGMPNQVPSRDGSGVR